MGATKTFPDGTELVSSALTLAQINQILWTQTMGMLGLVAPGAPPDSTSSAVRLQWPTVGAPFQQVSDDVCYLACLLIDDPYDKIRDVAVIPSAGWGGNGWGTAPWGGTGNGTQQFTEQWNYTRVWEIRWCMYGPNSLDLSRILRSALYQEYFTTQLAKNNLFPVSDFPQPVRAPELINAEWWERVDSKCLIYEFVTETINKNSVVSVEVLVNDDSGQIADVTVNPSVYGGPGTYNRGIYAGGGTT